MIPALVLIGLAWLGVGAVLGERFAKEKGIKPAVGFGLGALLGPFAFVMKREGEARSAAASNAFPWRLAAPQLRPRTDDVRLIGRAP
jgi:hypothetical protein